MGLFKTYHSNSNFHHSYYTQKYQLFCKGEQPGSKPVINMKLTHYLSATSHQGPHMKTPTQLLKLPNCSKYSENQDFIWHFLVAHCATAKNVFVCFSFFCLFCFFTSSFYFNLFVFKFSWLISAVRAGKLFY